MENWYDAFGDNWAERLGNIASITSPQATGWAKLGGRLIDDGNNPKPKRLPVAESYMSMPGDGFPAAPEPSSYDDSYARRLEQSRKFNPTEGVSLMPRQQSWQQPEQQDPSGRGQAGEALEKNMAQMNSTQQMGQQQAAQSQQQSGAMAGMAAQALSAAGYSI